MTEDNYIDITKEDEVANIILLNHAYIFETGKLVMQTAEQIRINKGIRIEFSDIAIDESMVDTALVKAGFDKGRIGPTAAGLVVDDFLELKSKDDKEPMYHFMTKKGFSAFCSGYFLQDFYKYKRELAITDATIRAANTSQQAATTQGKQGMAIIYLTIVSLVLVTLTLIREFSDKTEGKLQSIVDTIAKTQKNMQEIQSSLQKMSSSMEGIKTDTILIKKKYP